MVMHFFYWGTNQFIVQRALSARSDVEARQGIYVGRGGMRELCTILMHKKEPDPKCTQIKQTDDLCCARVSVTRFMVSGADQLNR